ncbi:hypothetical protein GGQ64_002558 [Rhizobium azooxidifex]|uniref:Uncharacterized protein n=1 Tax=Mycoplana azooxidifex TaxID=1636188 RepID=A0A7W6DB12_9HYPH|nr:hypothetical protein [Mycoplana azooxidifex]MBB3977352.1 hypothetical protein [Mycoplana azooxidifex]
MTWQKKYRWVRTWGDETGIDGKPHEDYQGFDGEQNVGRIFLDLQTLKEGQWRWAGGFIRGVPVAMPNSAHGRGILGQAEGEMTNVG